MRDQYAGDITDFIKFAYLRSVVPPRSKLGVAWYYLPNHDGRLDGRHTEYLSETKWLKLDSGLHFELAQVGGQRSVATLQKLKIWRGRKTFHVEPVENASRRLEWGQRMIECLNDCDVVFADPDNGLSRNGVVSRKSATFEEISMLAEGSRPAILIRFPARNSKHSEQLVVHHSTLARYKPVTVQTCVQISNKNGHKFPRIRWFTLLNPSREMTEAIHEFALRLNSVPGARASVSECQ